MTALAAALSKAFPRLRASDDGADRDAYARDMWPRHHLDVRAGSSPTARRPGAIVWPRSTDEVAHLVRWAASQGVPLVPFGAGSGVCAGVLPREDVVVVDVKAMSRVRAIDRDGPWVEVEAGCLGVPFERALARSGMTAGHFPSSILCSTVGGWVAARSAGQCSGAYGKIEDMVVALECVTGRGEVAHLRRRTSDVDLVPLVVGSEGTLAVVTSVTLRLHPAPQARSFGAWSFPTTRQGCDALRLLFQSGLRPAVARLYDPLDAAAARRSRAASPTSRAASTGLDGVVLRALMRRAGAINRWAHSDRLGRALGGALLVVVFEGSDGACERGLRDARHLAERTSGAWLGEGPARRWLERRYAVSYRQAPLFARGAFVDTMEVATRWSTLNDVHEAVREAIEGDALVTAHFSHAYPDGCCIYFSFAGVAAPDVARRTAAGWDAACEATYDRTWRRALAAATAAGATLAHHHGVGRSKAPRLEAELGPTGVDVVRALMRAFDPAGVLNPGNLVPDKTATGVRSPMSTIAPSTAAAGSPPVHLDAESLLACVAGDARLASVEAYLRERGLTLDVGHTGDDAVDDWLAAGAPGARDRWLDPADQLVAGLVARLADGRRLEIRPAPRRAVGPDLAALFVGARRRFGHIDRAWLRVHRRDVARPAVGSLACEADPPPSPEERSLVDAVEREVRGAPGAR